MRNNLNKQSFSYSNLLDLRFTTSVKGFAIIMIILTHAHQPFTELNPIIKNPLSFCQMGTQIFLILSCFGLCISYTKNKPRYFPFLKHRVLKIGVAYWIAILLYLILALISNLYYSENIIGTSTNPIAIICNVFLSHGIIPVMEVCNNVVRGGWFIGTIVLFYVIFPFLYKIYFLQKSKVWQKYRIIIFPVITQIISFVIIYGLGILYSKGIIRENLICYNNSVVYFNIINQLPCLCLGFSLYDICVNFNKRIRFTLLYSLLFFGISIFLFFFFGIHSILIRTAFIIEPFVFGCGFVFFIFSLSPLVSNKAKKQIKKSKSIMFKFGIASFGIYLIHFFFVYDLERYVLKIINPATGTIFYTLTFALCLLIVFPLSYFAGWLMNIFVQKINCILKN